MHYGIHTKCNQLQKYLASTWYILDGKIFCSYKEKLSVMSGMSRDRHSVSITGQILIVIYSWFWEIF